MASGEIPSPAPETIKILTYMKKEYLEPEVRVAQLGFEVNFLTSTFTLGGLGGEDLDDPDDPFDPWS